MHKLVSLMTIVFVLSIMAIGPAQAMSVETMVELKKAGLSDATIQMAAREKVIETVAFTAEELIQLKQAGFEERTIQVLIQERSFMRGPQKVVYGRDTRPLRLSSVNDIIALKDAGMSDDVIQAIVKVAGSRKDEDYYRSWEMLENMNLEVDVGR